MGAMSVLFKTQKIVGATFEKVLTNLEKNLQVMSRNVKDELPAHIAPHVTPVTVWCICEYLLRWNKLRVR